MGGREGGGQTDRQIDRQTTRRTETETVRETEFTAAKSLSEETDRCDSDNTASEKSFL